MKGFIFSWSVLLVAATLYQSSESVICPPVDPEFAIHLPHPTNCSLFYMCDNGVAHVRPCPGGLHFNPVLQVCDWPISAGCTAGQHKCSPLESNNWSVWVPLSCQDADSPLNEGCQIFCGQGSELVGGNSAKCTENGWVNGNGNEQVPYCKRKPCHPLTNTNTSTWSPPSCHQDSSEVNQICSLTCEPGTETSGGRTAKCSADGWVGMNGLNQIPECKVISDLGGGFIDRINKTLHARPANMLFLLDKSGSVASHEFTMEIQFMKALVAAFPLASDRSAGSISFDHSAIVNIRMDTDDTCAFMNEADGIMYNGGGTDIAQALQLAIAEINAKSVHNFTLVFLVTDGESQTDPTAPANVLKADGHALFTIGIANYNPAQLIPLSSVDEEGAPIFFGIDSFEIFEKVAEYLETAYNNGALNCTSAP